MLETLPLELSEAPSHLDSELSDSQIPEALVHQVETLVQEETLAHLEETTSKPSTHLQL